ncbi:hypothetical protein Ari01nite_92010 [Paractinoplanes rishiriensis]|uniref:Uncharacterized protein n=2 Tax=Paractinoplanes rishiriensis TaxID=1050105 RepID=A0A919MVS8_9ACTN|nr:hypothetical protein Ari01nite_92010 [Actinoplanes rishiriensis]
MARWLVLACTVIGLTAMHSLGHAGMAGHHETHGDARSTATTAGVASWTEGCPGDSCPMTPGHGSPAGWSACLAILSGVAVVAMLVVLIVATRRRGAAGTLEWLPGSPPRASPGRQSWNAALPLTTVLRI